MDVPTLQIMISGNAVNLRSGSEISSQTARDHEVNDTMTKYTILWNFISRKSSWHKGFYEREIGLVIGYGPKI